MSYDPVVARQRGIDAYVNFQNAALNYPQNYTFSLDQATSYIDSQSPQFFELLGKTIIQGNIDSETVAQKLSALAIQNQGTLPSHLSEFLKAFGSTETDGWSWTDAVRAVAAGVGDTVSSVATNVESFSTAVVSNTAQGVVTIAKFLPVIAIGALFLFVFIEAGGLKR